MKSLNVSKRFWEKKMNNIFIDQKVDYIDSLFLYSKKKGEASGSQ